MYLYVQVHFFIDAKQGFRIVRKSDEGEKWQNKYSKINSGCENLNFTKNVDETDLQGGDSYIHSWI